MHTEQRCAGQVIFMPRGPRPVASLSSRPSVPADQSLKQTRPCPIENFPLPRPARPRDSKDFIPTRLSADFATGPRPPSYDP